jgi:hypothetical protein
VYPLHRTSLWSQLYGRAHIVHFAQHPPSWRNTSPPVAAISRLILLFALVPTTLLLAGMVRMLWRLGAAASSDALLAVTALGFFAFMIAYTISYRDFSTMKAEFLFPGLLAYVLLFAGEAERFTAHYGQSPRIRHGLVWAHVVLLSLYVADTATLAVQLT